MPSPSIPVVVVDLVLSSVLRTTSLAWKSPKVPLEEIATLRFSIPFSGVTAVLKYRMKYTITLPGLKQKSTKTARNKFILKYLALNLDLGYKHRPLTGLDLFWRPPPHI